MVDSSSNELFSMPENDRRVMRSWERFVSGCHSDPETSRGLIDRSWQRCLTDGVDPALARAPALLDEERLRSLRADRETLLKAAAPALAAARELLAGSATFIVLTDQAGTILTSEGDPAARLAAEQICLLPGANWSERSCGTNAIGTALALGRMVQVHSSEHYCSGIKPWTCSAAVVRDPASGEVIAVVDVSGLSTAYSRHSLALAENTAARIENRLAKLEIRARYQLLERCIEPLSGCGRDAVIVFDRHGQAIKANGRVVSALARLGRGDAGSDPNLLTNLRVGWCDGAVSALDLPDWIAPEWIAPVVERKRVLGAILTIPHRDGPATGRPGAAAPVLVAADKGRFARLIGESPALLQAIERARQLARSRVPILLLGETGVGKEVFARCIHESSATAEAPFVAVNCGAFSHELLHSELFGYAEGAFTGARRGGMVGKIEAADAGTLFLDELGEMPVELQPHFLRVLESGEFYRLGENRPRKSCFRLIAATNRDLRQDIPQGRFRMDLFYRVAVTSIQLPSLRERIDDIPLLASHYIATLARAHGLAPCRLAPEVLDLFRSYAWPGNIREFRNVIENLLLTTHVPVLTEADLPPDVLADLLGATGHNEAITSLPTLAATERDAIERAIVRCRGNMAAVARDLGIAKSTAYLKLKRFGLEQMLADLRRHTDEG